MLDERIVKGIHPADTWQSVSSCIYPCPRLTGGLLLYHRANTHGGTWQLAAGFPTDRALLRTVAFPPQLHNVPQLPLALERVLQNTLRFNKTVALRR